MSESKVLPDYRDIVEELGCVKQPVLPAELHGYMTGIFSGIQSHDAAGFKMVLSRLCEEGYDSDQAKQLLAELALITTQQLQSNNFTFQMLLPNDEAALALRCEALACWCQGFISGLGVSNISTDTLKSKDVEEALQDISNIAQTSFQDINTDEESEKAYAELSEYIRMAVLLIYLHVRGKAKHASEALH